MSVFIWTFVFITIIIIQSVGAHIHQYLQDI
jgi:hypothetical protein